MKTEPAVRQVYISHSPRDKELARDMARRVRSAGMLPMPDIGPLPRPEFRKTLRERVRGADAVLMLVTPAAVESGEIIWDLGLAEGLDKIVVPVTVGVEAAQLPEPLQTYRTLPYDQLDEAIASLTEHTAGSK